MFFGLTSIVISKIKEKFWPQLKRSVLGGRTERRFSKPCMENFGFPGSH